MAKTRQLDKHRNTICYAPICQNCNAAARECLCEAPDIRDVRCRYRCESCGINISPARTKQYEKICRECAYDDGLFL